MPHIILEHSFPIPTNKLNSLLLSLNQNISKHEGNFDISQCKARSVFVNNFVIGNGNLSQDFIHIAINIMEGRSLEIRQNLAKNLLQIVGNFLQENQLSSKSIALSIDISQMTKEIYQKTVITN
ncbi:MAG: 5-carboxymethyl-2-hydroxymuconate isomerase [Rickettsiales bacterium]